MAMWVPNKLPFQWRLRTNGRGQFWTCHPAPLIMPNRSLVNFETIHMSVSFRKNFAGETTWDDTTWRQSWSPRYLYCLWHRPVLEIRMFPFQSQKKAKVPRLFMFFFWKSQMFLTESPSQSFRPVLVMVPSPSVSQVLKASRTRSDNRAMAPEKKLPMTTSPRGISPSESGHN